MESFIRQSTAGGVMRRRSVELHHNFTATSVNSRRNTGKIKTMNHNVERSCWAKPRIFIVNFYSASNSHNLRSHQKIRHAEYQGEGVTITTVRKSRSSANAQQTSFNAPAAHSQASSLIISPPPPPNLLNLNSSDMKNSLPVYKSDWNSKWGVLGGNHFYCWC